MPKKILIVEDEVVLREIFKDELSEQGYAVRVAGTRKECLEILTQGVVDLIILDLKLPDVKEFELLDEIHQKYPQLPVLLCTAYDLFHSKETHWKEKIVGFLIKPVSLENLRKSVKKIIG
jgi:ATP-dependent Lon protease